MEYTQYETDFMANLVLQTIDQNRWDCWRWASIEGRHIRFDVVTRQWQKLVLFVCPGAIGFWPQVITWTCNRLQKLQAIAPGESLEMVLESRPGKARSL
jgi:hypothetical protein